MIAHLLEGKSMAPALEEMILEKTEGVPFFIEEFIRSWKDLKVLQLDGPAYRLADPSERGRSLPLSTSDHGPGGRPPGTGQGDPEDGVRNRKGIHP